MPQYDANDSRVTRPHNHFLTILEAHFTDKFTTQHTTQVKRMFGCSLLVLHLEDARRAEAEIGIVDGIDDSEEEDEYSDTEIENHFFAERIITHYLSPRGSVKYLVKWKGYSILESTWEPEKNIGSRNPILTEYRNQVRADNADVSSSPSSSSSSKTSSSKTAPAPSDHHNTIVGFKFGSIFSLIKNQQVS